MLTRLRFAALLLLCAVPCSGLSAVALRPDLMTVAELEATFGRNLLEADPNPWDPPPGVADDLVVHRWYGSAPGKLNAFLNSDANLYDCIWSYCTMDPALKHRDDPNRWAPGVADYASLSADGKVVTVRLRRGVHWQFPAVDRNDPKYRWLVELFQDRAPELTAGDFRFSLAVIQHPDSKVSYRPYVANASIQELDTYTFQMTWSEFEVYAFDMSVTWPGVLPEFLYSRDESGRPFSESELGEAFRDHWYNFKVCGYGPYEFVGMEPNVEIVLRRMDGFSPLRPAVKELRWRIIDDAEQVVLNLLDGQVDHITLGPDQYRKWVLDAGADSAFKKGGFQTALYSKLEYLYLGWNCRRPPFDDKRVRRAMSLAFNREVFLNNQFIGLGALVDSHVNVNHRHCNPNLTPIRFDLDGASRLLDSAGWGDGDGDGVRDKQIDGKQVDLKFTMLCFRESNEFQSVLAVYREDLLGIGIDMTVETLEASEVMRRMRSFEFDAYTGLWGLGWMLNFINQFHTSSIADGSNFVGYSNAEADELMWQYIYGGVDDESRRKLAFRVQEIIHDEQPYTFFMRRDRLTVYQPWLRGVHYTAVRPQLLSWSWYRGN